MFDPLRPGPALLSLVRAAVLARADGAPAPTPAPLPRPWDRAAGCVVTLLDDHGARLGSAARVGRSMGHLAAALTAAAWEAAAGAGPAAPLWARVDVIDHVAAVRSPSRLDPARYGVIVDDGTRRGAWPPLVDGVADVGAQIALAREQAGIAASARVRLSRFTGECFSDVVIAALRDVG